MNRVCLFVTLVSLPGFFMGLPLDTTICFVSFQFWWVSGTNDQALCWPVTRLLLSLVTNAETEPDITEWGPAQVRGESESHDRQRWYVWVRVNPDTTSCKTEVAGGGGMLSGRSPVAPAGICCPPVVTTNPPPPPILQPLQPPTFPAGHWCSRLAHCQQMAGMRRPRGAGQGPASGELIPLCSLKGAHPRARHMQRSPWLRQCRQAGSLRWWW